MEMENNVFNCLTTDDGDTTFYGMILEHDYAINKYQHHQSDVVAVVKSNTSLASPSSLTWSVVSKINYESLTGRVVHPDTLARCAINSKGVFSLFVHFGFSSSGLAGPRIYQFNPKGKTMDASFNYKGIGSWSNVTIDTTHPTITRSLLHPRLQHFYNRQVETLIFSFLGDDLNVELAVLNEATNTLAHAATWKMNETLYGFLSDTVISGDRLFTISEGKSPDHPLPFVGSFPFSAKVPANTPEGRTVDASAFGGLDWSDDLRLDLVSSAGTLYVLAIRGSLTKKDSDSVLISRTHYASVQATLGRAVNISQRLFYYRQFVPINGQFALVNFKDQLDAITLSGPSLGNYYANISINISDSIDPNFKFEAVQSSDKIGLIIGVTAAVVALVGAGVGYFFWRKRCKDRAPGAAGAAEEFTAAPVLPPKDHACTQNHSFIQKVEPRIDVGYGDRPNAYDHITGFIGATPAPPVTATAFSPTTATTTVSGSQGQASQNHMHGLQLSNHPRPNVVTTGVAVGLNGSPGAGASLKYILEKCSGKEDQ